MEHGMPYRAGPNCWLYHATKKGTSADGDALLLHVRAHLGDPDRPARLTGKLRGL